MNIIEKRKLQRKQIIDNAVANFHRAGYTTATAETVLTDTMLGSMFVSMLRENLGKVKELNMPLRNLIDEVTVNIGKIQPTRPKQSR